jgi:hypothetical protein
MLSSRDLVLPGYWCPGERVWGSFSPFGVFSRTLEVLTGTLVVLAVDLAAANIVADDKSMRTTKIECSAGPGCRVISSLTVSDKEWRQDCGLAQWSKSGMSIQCDTKEGNAMPLSHISVGTSIGHNHLSVNQASSRECLPNWGLGTRVSSATTARTTEKRGEALWVYSPGV